MFTFSNTSVRVEPFFIINISIKTSHFEGRNQGNPLYQFQSVCLFASVEIVGNHQDFLYISISFSNTSVGIDLFGQKSGKYLSLSSK